MISRMESIHLKQISQPCSLFIIFITNWSKCQWICTSSIEVDQEALTSLCTQYLQLMHGAKGITVSSPELMLLLHHTACINSQRIYFYTGRIGKHTVAKIFISVHTHIHAILKEAQKTDAGGGIVWLAVTQPVSYIFEDWKGHSCWLKKGRDAQRLA